MTRLVLDASAAVALVLGRHPEAQATIELMEEAEVVLAPRFYWSEVANALWKYVRRSALSEAAAIAGLDQASAIIDEAVDDELLSTEALVVAIRFDHPVYDALYAVLARRRGAAVITLDRRLRSLLRKMRVDAV